MAIQNTEMEGDLSVGRNVKAGGTLDVRGSATVGHNLKVEGWLEAVNIKGPNKGVFLTEGDLRSAYPMPHDGWFAGVGSSTPFRAYIGQGGEWVASGGTMEVTVDMSAYTEGVAALQEDIDAVKADIGANDNSGLKRRVRMVEDLAAGHTTQLTTLGTNLSETTSKTAAAQARADEAYTLADSGVIKAEAVGVEAQKAQNTADEALRTAKEGKELAEIVHHAPIARFYDVIGEDVEIENTTYTGPRNTDGMSEIIVYVARQKVFAYAGTDGKLYRMWRPELGEEEMQDVRGEALQYNDDHMDQARGNQLYLNSRLGMLFFIDKEKNLVPVQGELTAVQQQIENLETTMTRAVAAGYNQLNALVAPRLMVNANKLFPSVETFSDLNMLRTQLAGLTSDQQALYKVSGAVFTMKTGEGWQTWQWTGSTEEEWASDDTWKKFGGSASVGNCYNVTNDVPLENGEYYDLERAIEVAWEKGYTTVGIQLTFAIADKSWKTYQYVGPNSNEGQFKNQYDNWIDLAGMSAGAETVININALCETPNQLTLQGAISALTTLQEQTGISYAKSGLVITYLSGLREWTTKQYKGQATDDIRDESLWVDFGGGGGGLVETSDEPAMDGEDAFSTGGAYKHIPASLVVDTEEEGVVKLKMQNAAGDDVGDEVQFTVGTGSGGEGGGGTIVSLAYQSSPLYGNLGNDLIIRAAVRSVTTMGQTEQDNTIATIALYDRDTNMLLKTLTFNRASSGSMTDYTFQIDVTEYFASAGVRRFRLVAEDDSGHTGSRNINVTAVDVTVTSTQTLQYTQSTALRAGGGSQSISLYKFANNASDQGITAITEIMLNGEWRELGRQVVRDTYSNSISIDPSNCLGQALTHGVYPLRVHGVDVASGVEGNYLYTGVFVIDTASTTPLVVLQWYSEGERATVKLYETVRVSYAVYDPATSAPTATVYMNGVQVSQQTAHRSASYTFTHQVTGMVSDGSVSEVVKIGCGTSYSVEAEFAISGSVIDAAIKAGAILALDFANRSNEETSHAIESGGYTLATTGMNFSTTGFVPMSAGGEMALRFAEDAKGELDFYPFQPSSIESNGLGVQFAFASKNMVDDDAVLMSCYDEGIGAGFYVTGKAVGIYCSTGLSNHVEERFYKQGEKVTVAVVVEPVAEGLGQTRNGTTYYFIKLYLNGEEVAAIGYVAGQSNLLQNKPITFDGSNGDLYLYYMLAWNDYFQFDQAFQNYLVKLTNTEDMVREFDFEDIMASQQVTELDITTTKLRPQASALAAQGMPYVIECPYAGSNIEALDTTTSTKDNNYITLYYIDPNRPWTNFRADDVRRRNQGTTSAQRPVKNPRYYLAQKNGSTYNKTTKTGGTTITLLNPDSSTEEGRRAIALAAINKVQLHEDSIPVDIITIKVDYSDSSNANDCGVCDMMNATFRAVGAQYLTPAQRAFDGTWKKGSIELSGLVMNHSTANFPIAMFRSKESTGTNPYFHSKGNWKEDKKEQTALGFIDTPGYNKGCLNYGDFIEFYGLEGESLADAKVRFAATSGLDTEATYIITEYCGSSYKVMKYNGRSWGEQTGSMVQNSNGRWTVTGSVLNPVEGFELLNYQGMDWFKGVRTVADLMAPSTSYSKWVQALIDGGDISVESVPAWTYYYESLVDDDDLAIAYALGKKVPYNLYRWMEFCNRCDWDSYHGSDSDGGAARLALWKSDLYKYASPHSCLAYDIFTDYLAAVDQRAKNMQPMWFLEDGCKVVNGVYYNADGEANDSTSGMLAMRMYLNKVYDCDTCNGKDNDGGQTIDAEVDPNRLPDEATGYTNPYAGYNSVLFRNMYLQQTVNIDAAGTELNLKTVASAMRSCTATVDGQTIHPFSPEGAQYFFVTARIKRWPKKVSSYDGERKYIDFTSTTANNIYFYALQGLGLTSLPAFIERRWRIRDGFFGTGDFFSGVLSGRVNSADNATIRIKAAKTGYFGIGNDSSGSLSESVYLEAGEEHTFTDFSHEEGALLYIYQADRMSEIDLSEIALSSNFDFSVMTLAEKIVLGKSGKADMSIGAYTKLTNVNLGELPFLKEFDIRDTIITNVVASGCPRLQTLNAEGSQLVRADIADGSKITSMVLPATYQYLKLRYLPNLTLSGLELADAASITTLVVEECANIDPIVLLRRIAGASGSALRVVRATGINATYNGSDLAAWADRGWTGLDTNLTAQDEPAVGGVYMLSVYTDEADLAAWQGEFPELTIHQAQYTMVRFDDTMSDPKNITNLDNGSTGESYAPSGHISKIQSMRKPVTGKLNPLTGDFECREMSKEHYQRLADGSSFDYQDSLGSGNDAFILEPHCWYKGINDYKNQKKYIAWSSLEEEPLSTATEVRRARLATLTPQENTALNVNYINEGASVLTDTGVLQAVSNINTYQFDVEGMKQVRWPGLNNLSHGACFLDGEGVIIKKFNMAISTSEFDFDETDGDYIFTDVPEGAKTFVFSTRYTSTDKEVIAVDSEEIEAIEPDWVEHKPCLGAIYQASIDSLMQIRSLSNKSTRVGTGTSTTWAGWWNAGNSTGDPDNTPSASDTLNYTGKDLMNFAKRRGAGYQLFDYEMSKFAAILYYSLKGNRDAQLLCGYGRTAGGTTGYKDSIGFADSVRTGASNEGNKCMGYESFFGCTWEFMDNVALNVPTYAQAYKDKMVSNTAYPINGVWHIYDPVEKAERTVKGITQSGLCIVRTKHGRHCDLVASKGVSNSDWDKWYTDIYYYTADRCRVVGRSSDTASAVGGLAYADSGYAASRSYSHGVARLAFRPPVGCKIVIADAD